MLLFCNTLWCAWSLLASKSRRIWSFGSNQSLCFFSCLPRDALAVSYTTCWKLFQQVMSLSSDDLARALSISCTRLSAWLVFLSLLVFSFTGFIAPLWLCFLLIMKMTLDLNIWWSVPQFAPRIVRVLQMSILSRHLVMMKSIICPCRERGCVHVVLCASFCLNMVLVTIRSNSVHSANRSSPLELHFPIPYLPKAEGHLSFSLPHVMKTACKYVEVLLAFAGYQQHSLGGFNSSFTSARMYPDRCRPLVPAVVGQVMLGVPFIKRPLCYHSNIIFCWGLFPSPFTIPSPHKAVRLFDP